jgi:hypothetical protein
MRETDPLVLILPIVLIQGVLAGPAWPAETPEQLVASLAQAAHHRDAAGFIANMSRASKRALADTQEMQARLVQAERSYQDTLDQRFGKGHTFPPSPPTPQATLSVGAPRFHASSEQTSIFAADRCST